MGSELERYAEFFEPKTHERDSMASLYRPIRELSWAVSESPDSMFVSATNEYPDMRTFLTYVAVENFLADRDGLLGDWGMNNFYLYRTQRQRRQISSRLPLSTTGFPSPRTPEPRQRSIPVCSLA